MDASISQPGYRQKNWRMRFEEAYQGWTPGWLTQAEAALLLGHWERSLRRYIERFQAHGLEGRLDKQLSQISKRRANQAKIDGVVHSYKSGLSGWNMRHFHGKYRSGQPLSFDSRGRRQGRQATAGRGRSGAAPAGHRAHWRVFAGGERAFHTHQGRLPNELARAGITDMQSANQYLEMHYRPSHNGASCVASTVPGTAYVPFIGASLPDIL